MAKPNLKSPELFINRELSWLEFNDRVLREGLDESLPLLERLKFLSIVSSNLDEFFLIRVAGLAQQVAAGLRRRDLSGLTPAQQLAAISDRAHRMIAEQTDGIHRAMQDLAGRGVYFLDVAGVSAQQRRFLTSYFHNDILPMLTPLAVEKLDPCPRLPGLRLMLAFRLAPLAVDKAAEWTAVVPVPTGLPRFVALPAEEGLHLVRLEDIIATHAGAVFPDNEVRAGATFRLTRDADVDIDDDAVGDLLEAVEQAVLSRRRRRVVRLEISARPNRRLKKWLTEFADIKPRDVYEIDGMLDAKALMEVATRPGFEELKIADWPPLPPADLTDEEDLWQVLRSRDVMLFHPYESFDPVVKLLDLAADDPNVLAVKQTLYRTSGDSPVIAALERAAANGKQVTVLVELKARFDEQRNVNWARRLEDAGAYVIYGIAGYKTHAKALLIVRREAGRVRRYVHLATGNYNDKTARLYSDIGMMTTHAEIAADTAAFFNLLTGYSEAVGWSKLTIAPTDLRARFLELIDREIQVSTPEEPGRIMVKTNSLHDEKIARALYKASRAGVQVKLNVRGICCLRPGLKRVSRNIEVVSIVDRFLEHARIFAFRNGGHEEVYMSSADWMTRNLDKRLELLFPILDPKLRRRTIDILETFFTDNVKARRLQPDGAYERIERDGKAIRAQEVFYTQASRAAKSKRKGRVRFRPLKGSEA